MCLSDARQSNQVFLYECIECVCTSLCPHILHICSCGSHIELFHAVILPEASVRSQHWCWLVLSLASTASIIPWECSQAMLRQPTVHGYLTLHLMLTQLVSKQRNCSSSNVVGMHRNRKFYNFQYRHISPRHFHKLVKVDYSVCQTCESF